MTPRGTCITCKSSRFRVIPRATKDGLSLGGTCGILSRTISKGGASISFSDRPSICMGTSVADSGPSLRTSLGTYGGFAGTGVACAFKSRARALSKGAVGS